jgi:peptidoglycan/xylan/chitin deacetylase (PgdA/CDA1 family)
VFAWKIWLRWLIAGTLYYSGSLFLLCRIKRSGYPILTYHRVLDAATARTQAVPAGMYVRPQTFEKHLRYLQRRYRVVTIEELLAHRDHSKARNRPLCALTFDDGWNDNYEKALPLLSRYRMPATLFVSTDFIGRDHTPWFYRLGHLLQALSEMPDGACEALLLNSPKLPSAVRRWSSTSMTDRQRNVDEVIESLKVLPSTELEAVISHLQDLVALCRQSANGNGSAMLNWEQLREMASSSVEIGSHGMTHMILTQMPLAQAKTEIEESKRCIEEQVKNPVKGFSYPNGNYSLDLEMLVRSCGYRYACTARPGHVDATGSPYELKRINVHDDVTFSTALFACQISGIFKLV